MDKKPVIIGISGASGSALAHAAVERILALEWPVIATISPAARMVWRGEMAESFGEAIERWTDTGLFTTYPIGDLAAPIASGTYPVHGMAIVPCSMGTAAAIATGLSDNLMRRAADVALKERNPLVIIPRETPMNAIHLENLAKIARLGATILPPHPAFYLNPQTTADTIDFITHRLLLSLGLTATLPARLQYKPEEEN